MKKIEMVVDECTICPFKDYDYTTNLICKLEKKMIQPGKKIPEWCPLPDMEYKE